MKAIKILSKIVLFIVIFVGSVTIIIGSVIIIAAVCHKDGIQSIEYGLNP
jgi:hypothetical protein